MTEQEQLKNRDWSNQIQSYEALASEEESKLNVDQGIKLGWIQGVLIPCLLSIWGVILFLRLPWMVAQAGVRDSIIIIFISLIIITITTFSLSAISTNGRVKGGGLYFIISRSIGPELGASIGALLAVANVASVALNTVGFCASLDSLLRTFGVHALQTYIGFTSTGVVAVLVMGALCALGMDDEAKIQNALLAFIVAAIFDVIAGSLGGPDPGNGFGTAVDAGTFGRNWGPDYRTQDCTTHSLVTIFAIFFPAVTGIQAGANISGDLKDPSAAIPKGTLISILITITSYVILVIIPGAVHLREAIQLPNQLQNLSSLNSSDVIYSQGLYCNENDTSAANGTLISILSTITSYVIPEAVHLREAIQVLYPLRNVSSLDCSNETYSQGLYCDENVMQTISAWPYLIYMGCIAATLSTALTSLIAVPKILQRMGQDDVYPFLKYVAKGYGISNEPYRAHVLAVFASSIFLLLGELNEIASFMSTIYLCAYALLNACTFHAAHFKSLGWRPSYKFYNKWLSLAGGVVCFSIAILIDPTMLAIVVCIISALYFAAAKKTNTVNWGSSNQAKQIKSVIKKVYQAKVIQHHVKNYIPNIVVLSGEPETRQELVYLAHLITKDNGLQTCLNVNKNALTYAQKRDLLRKGAEWLERTAVESLYNVLDAVDLDMGVRAVIDCGGCGVLGPNAVVVGHKTDWYSNADDVRTYLEALNVAHANGLATLVVRLPPIVGCAKTVNEEVPGVVGADRKSDGKQAEEEKIELEPLDRPVNVHSSRFSFVEKRKTGTVDVWWLCDDGGLALIVAHILQSRDAWRQCTFRIFGVSDQIGNLDTEKNKLKQLLTMYRIQFDFIDVVLANATSPKTVANFTALWNQRFFFYQDGRRHDDGNYDIKRAINTLYVKDLLETYSIRSDLIVISMFKIKKTLDETHMCWMEAVTGGLPPCIVIQGNVVQTVTASA